MKYKISSDYLKPGIPAWEREETRHPDRAPRISRRFFAARPDKYFSRLAWMTRAHPNELPSGRILVPLYPDGYDFSIVAYTDDGGSHWESSDPIVGGGSIQPSIVRRKDGTLVAYMRDNAPRRSEFTPAGRGTTAWRGRR